MASSFKPPGIKRLTEIDVADCEYNAEAVEIEGLVSAKSQGGWPRTDDYEIHCFSLVAWRRVGGRLIQQELTILRPVPPQFDYWSDFPAYSVHRLHLLLSQDETRAIFAGPSQVIVDDTELLAIAGELQKPVVISTSRFGDLTLDRKLDRFEGEPNWNGLSVYITFERDLDGSIETGLSAAEALWDEAAAWNRRVEDYAVQELLPVKNDGWLEVDEEPMTTEQFKERMTLEEIGIKRDGSFEFWHDDGDLFYGHSIMVAGSLEDGLTEADIPG